MEFAIHLPPNRLLELLNEAEPKLSQTADIRRWCCFWRGAASVQDGLREAIPLLREATNMALAADDRLLIREASYLWAVCEILAGNAERALEISERAVVAIRDRSLLKCGRLADLRSSALVHLGFKEDGLKVLQRRGAEAGSKIEFAKNEALRALYTATGGNLSGASEINMTPQRVSRETGAKGVEAICWLTQGYLKAIDEPDGAVERLRELIRYCKLHGFSHVALYAQETLALALRNCDRIEEAKGALKASAANRKRLGFRYTRWDQTRLRSLVSLA